MAKKSKVLVGIIMGSESDAPVMDQACTLLKSFKVPFEVRVLSAHRTPETMMAYAKTARRRGLLVIIAGAGGAAHLPGMVASLTTLPVIGVPVITGSLQGEDALLSIVQMPKGIPVATVAIGNAENAALLAVQILGTRNKALALKLEKHRKGMQTKVKAMNVRVQKLSLENKT